MRADIGDPPSSVRRSARHFPAEEFAEQRTAAAVALLRDLTVIAGGPGTGKTTTVARIVALSEAFAVEASARLPLIGLCAPTGKAAARLQEAVGGSVRASTIHRLLGWLPGGRFRHDASNRLPHDLVIVDETSMVPLSLMVRLVEAVATTLSWCWWATPISSPRSRSEPCCGTSSVRRPSNHSSARACEPPSPE